MITAIRLPNPKTTPNPIIINCPEIIYVVYLLYSLVNVPLQKVIVTVFPINPIMPLMTKNATAALITRKEIILNIKSILSTLENYILI
jgi:hypothetical protein